MRCGASLRLDGRGARPYTGSGWTGEPLVPTLALLRLEGRDARPPRTLVGKPASYLLCGWHALQFLILEWAVADFPIAVMNNLHAAPKSDGTTLRATSGAEQGE